MITISLLVRALTINYSLVMDADRKPLWRLPPAQRFQTMIYQSVIWTTVFCAAFEVWTWYGELVVGQLIILLGFVLTSITFARAERAAVLPETIRAQSVRDIKRH